MSKIPNYYKLTHVSTGEVLEGIAKELAITLNTTTKKISNAFYDERTILGYKVEKIVQEDIGDNDIFAEWDRFVAGVQKKYGKKRA
jgi:hypothetical protein